MNANNQHLPWVEHKLSKADDHKICASRTCDLIKELEISGDESSLSFEHLFYISDKFVDLGILQSSRT